MRKVLTFSIPEGWDILDKLRKKFFDKDDSKIIRLALEKLWDSGKNKQETVILPNAEEFTMALSKIETEQEAKEVYCLATQLMELAKGTYKSKRVRQ